MPVSQIGRQCSIREIHEIKWYKKMSKPIMQNAYHEIGWLL